ncbi:MAG: radical SAM protein [Bacteroidetes bacterium]|jgi:radical SAM enzyme (TIGR01210 family)|nr:radical SAM protein [Bacteroidota bacterium]
MLKEIDNQTIESLRPEKALMNPFRPYAYLHEEEPDASGKMQKVNTLFLTNRECPFKCVMCDLWKNTLDEPTPAGAVPEQIEFALEQLPDADVVKLYNSGNFFDGKAIPREDYSRIAGLLKEADRVIVENHPKLIGDFIPAFRDMLSGELEIAMGLETIHPDVLPKLNKQITTGDFRNASAFLKNEGIDIRSFILLNPPFLTDPKENIEWCIKSVQFAFETGSDTVSIIPVRDGNGVMEELKKSGQYVQPTLKALEEAFDRSLGLKSGRVFCDLWDLQKFSDCDECFDERKERLDRMNRTQSILPHLICECNETEKGNK